MSLALHSFHQARSAAFTEVNGQEAAAHYGDWLAEYAALRDGAGLIDLSFRSRLCLLGADAQRFLHGQVTNNIKDLNVGAGCYAAVVSAKGKLQSDMNIYRLENELLLDFEPGFSKAVAERLEKYVIAEDVQIVDAAPHYGMLGIYGPKAEPALTAFAPNFPLPPTSMNATKWDHSAFGEIYAARRAAICGPGFDLFVPMNSMDGALEKLMASGGKLSGWQALETQRIETGVPRFGADMDETNLAPEAVDTRAISYAKGCYIGQEVIARVRTYGQVAKSLRGFKFASEAKEAPAKGAKLFIGDKEIGHITSAAWSPVLQKMVALGYIRREANQPGAAIELETAAGRIPVRAEEIPFKS